MSTATMHARLPILPVALAGLVISVAIVLYNLINQGHAAYGTDNLGMFWTFPIVVYDYFLLTSTGLAMVATLALVFGGDDFRPIIKRALWLALAGLAGGVAVLMLELGKPIQALWLIPFSFAFDSPLYWKVLCVLGYVLALLWLFSRLSRTGWSMASVRGMALLTLVLALGVTVIAGVVYGSQSMRPFWASGDIPVAFLFESLLGGLAFIIFFTYMAYGFKQDGLPASVNRLFSDKLPSLLALAIFLHMLFVLARMTSGLYGNAEGLQVWQHIVASPLFHLELWVGLVTPLVLLLLPTTRRIGSVQILAALLVMISLFIARYEYIIGGQLVPLFKGAWAPALLSYSPSPTEWMLLHPPCP
ncbi:MAG: polysulfide reductase NrfD [Xanthomonadaceae bacterium]|nr:polysulfide reductase NrfD [Xanthomonadaceae bacterium]